MSKISTYEDAPLPKLSDKLIGTSVGGEIEDMTYNFTLQELLNVFLPVIPANNLQGILDYGNTATQDINLFGTINTTYINVTDTATILNSNLTGETRILGGLIDSTYSIGEAGQVLSSTGEFVEWITLPPIFTPSLQQVLEVGNGSDINIILDATLQAFNVDSNTAIINDDLTISGTLTDSDSLVGTANQVLSSTVTGVKWIGLPIYSATSPLLFNSAIGVFSIQEAASYQSGYLSSTDWINFDGKQPAGNYITTLIGEASASGPGAASVILNNASVLGKVLTGFNPTSGTINASDTILTAFEKTQSQINALVGGVIYRGTWNASANVPTLTSSVGVQGDYYVVNVAGNTNLNGITDWKVGDWAIFSESVWQKVDNTDSVSSVNGYTGAVNLTTDDIPEGLTNLYYLNSRARAALSATSPLLYDNSTGISSIQQSNNIQDGYLSSTDWVTFNNKQGAITLTTVGSSGPSTLISNTLNIPNYGGALTGYVPYTGATTNVNLGEYGISAGYFQADLTPTGTLQVGRMQWNAIDGTMDLRMMGNNVTLQIGEENVTRVVNKSGINLLESNYQVVRARKVAEGGAQGQRIAVVLAQGNSENNSTEVLGLVTETINTNQEGFITCFGEVKEIDTTGSLQGETWVDGDILYLSSTVAGALTNVRPIAPNHSVIVGYVTYAHAVHGKIYMAIDTGYELGELHNVYAPSPTANQSIYWNATNSRYQLNTIAGILGYTPADAATYVPYTGATSNVDLGSYNLITTGSILSGYISALGNGIGGGYISFKTGALGGISSSYGTIGSPAVNQVSIYFGDTNLYAATLSNASLSASRTYTLPNASGTLALTSDLGGYVPYTGATTNLNLGAYALIVSGINNASGMSMSHSSEVSPGAGSTAINGTPNGLGVRVGASYVYSLIFPTANYNYTFPSATGTLALTSDLSAYVTLGTTQTISGAKTFSGVSTFTSPIIIDEGTTGTYLAFANYATATTGTLGYTSIYALNNNILGINFGGSKRGQFDSSAITSTAIRTYTLPNADGTLALTSSLAGYLPLTGGTLTGNLSITGTNPALLFTTNYSGTFGGVIGLASATNSYIQEAQNGDAVLGVDSGKNILFGVAAYPKLKVTSSNIVQVTSGVSLEVGYTALQSLYKFDVNGTTRLQGATIVGTSTGFTGSPTFGVQNKSGHVASIASFNFGGTETSNNSINSLINVGSYINAAVQTIATATTASGMQFYNGGFYWYGNTGLTVGAAYTNTQRMYLSSAGELTVSGKLILGSTISNGTYIYTLPSATGTLALTSNLSSYLPLSGGTLTGALSGTSATFTNQLSLDRASLTTATPLRFTTAGANNWFIGMSPLGTSTNDLSFYSYGTSSSALTLNNTTGTATFLSNVGIGISTPTGQLSLNNQINNGTTPISYYSSLNGTSGYYGQAIFNSYYASNLDGLGTYPRYLDIASVGSPDGTNGGSIIRFFTNGIVASSSATEKMRIDSSGNVGIGTSSPSTTLHVSAVSGNAITLVETSSGTFAQYQLKSGATTPWVIGTQNDYVSNGLVFRNGSDRMIITTGGNVGIGTSSPSSILHIKGVFTIERSSAAQTSTISNEGGNFTLNASSGYNTIFQSAAAERMRITSGGNVLIGTTTDAGWRLAVVGGGQLISGTNPAIYMQTTYSGSYYGVFGVASALNSYIQDANNGDICLGVDAGKNILLGVGANPKLKVLSSGVIQLASLAGAGSRTVNADASGNLSAASDSSLKQEDKEYSIAGLNEILKLTPRAYKWLKDIEKRGADASTELGFFANEVAPIIPSAAPKSNDGLYGFYDRAVIAALVKGMQEQQLQIQELKLIKNNIN